VKAYVMTTGVIFALLALAQRANAESCICDTGGRPLVAFPLISGSFSRYRRLTPLSNFLHPVRNQFPAGCGRRCWRPSPVGALRDGATTRAPP
jgi:hypothetical protein